MPGRLVFMTLAALVLGFVGWMLALEPRRPRSLVLISLDTLRADRLGTYGYHRPTSPTLDALAAQSVVFEKLIAVSSWTLPTHLTVFTGLYGLPVPSGLDGTSLVPWMRGGTSPIRAFQFSELDWHEELRSRFDPQHHLILDKRTKGTRLFDIREDPAEQEDIAPSHSDLATGLGSELEQFSTSLSSLPPAELPETTREQLDELRTLGYL